MVINKWEIWELSSVEHIYSCLTDFRGLFVSLFTFTQFLWARLLIAHWFIYPTCEHSLQRQKVKLLNTELDLTKGRPQLIKGNLYSTWRFCHAFQAGERKSAQEESPIEKGMIKLKRRDDCCLFLLFLVLIGPVVWSTHYTAHDQWMIMPYYGVLIYMAAGRGNWLVTIHHCNEPWGTQQFIQDMFHL